MKALQPPVGLTALAPPGHHLSSLICGQRVEWTFNLCTHVVSIQGYQLYKGCGDKLDIKQVDCKRLVLQDTDVSWRLAGGVSCQCLRKRQFEHTETLVANATERTTVVRRRSVWSVRGPIKTQNHASTRVQQNMTTSTRVSSLHQWILDSAQHIIQ